jgi:hypothetical protein
MTLLKLAPPSPTSSSCSSDTSSCDSSSVAEISKRSGMPEPVAAMARLSPATEVAIRLLPGNDVRPAAIAHWNKAC